MKKNVLSGVIVLSFLIFTQFSARSQVNVPSSNGYVVHVTVQPLTVIPNNNPCPNGYNYNLLVHYSVTFTGTNIPSNLYTLQGNIGCGSSTHFYSLPTTGGTGNLTTGSNVWNPNHDCATATVASLLCNTATLIIDGPGIPQQTISFTLATGGPLAIKLSSFNAEAIRDKVKLNWATASETNNDYFSIERSADGNSWTALKTVKAAGNSSVTTNYESFDDNPAVGTSYYRLKQTDFDGKFTYSDTRLVKYTTGNNIYAYPVPNAGNTVNFKGIIQPKNMELTVFNIAGAALYSNTLQSANVTLPVLKAGVYTLQLYNKITGEKTNLQYVKL